MSSPEFEIASVMATMLAASDYRGLHRLPDEHMPAIEFLEERLWADLTRAGPLWSNIRVIHDNRDLHPSRFMSGRIGDGLIVHSYPDSERITHYLADGATLIHNHLHESSPTIGRLHEILEYQLEARVWVQAYVTRTEGSAFGMHADDHNFIALQVAGRKRWQIDPAAAAESTPVDAIAVDTVEPGSFISVPAGTRHRVAGCGSLSLHLTIAFDWISGTRTGSALSVEEASKHRRCARQGSTLPLALCADMNLAALVFKFRDRVRPRITREESGITIKCSNGTFIVDTRFEHAVEVLASGQQLNFAELYSGAGDLKPRHLDKFLRFGVERGFLNCSG